MQSEPQINLILETGSVTPLFWQIYLQIRRQILAGDLEAGLRLPSSRQLAEVYHIGRVTVLQAYEQLRAEGFVETRQGAGTYVTPGLTIGYVNTAVAPFTPHFASWGQRVQKIAPHGDAPKQRAEIDFGFGRTFPHIFPYEIWRRLLARYLSTDDVMLSRYGSVAGFYPLRAAIAAYLARQRGVHCTADQIVIVNGAQQALDILARLLLPPDGEVLVETPGYDDAFALFRLHGAGLIGLPVDEAGFPVELIPVDCQARLVFITPTNQFPRGGTLPLWRRLALLQWARDHQALIIEDDYDGELRYDGRPLGTLYGLDQDGRVVYLGTFSKVLFPALRLGYVVLPPDLVRPFVQAKGLVDRGAPTLTQAAITDFIAEGYFERHLRHLRKAYGERHAQLMQALVKYLPNDVQLPRAPAGLHVMLYLPPHVDESRLIQDAFNAGVGIYPGAAYHLQSPAPPSILLGFSGLSAGEIKEGIRRLAQVFPKPAPIREAS